MGRRILFDSGARRVESRLRLRVIHLVTLAAVLLFAGILPEEARARQADALGLWRELPPTPVSSQGTNFLPLVLTDGGQTFPTLLAAAVDNSGSADVVLPAAAAAIVRVESIGNYFFADSEVAPVR